MSGRYLIDFFEEKEEEEEREEEEEERGKKEGYMCIEGMVYSTWPGRGDECILVKP